MTSSASNKPTAASDLAHRLMALREDWPSASQNTPQDAMASIPPRSSSPGGPDDAPSDLTILGEDLTIQPADFIHPPSTEQQVLRPYDRFRKAPITAFQELGRHVSGVGWRGYNNILGQENFYSGFTEGMKKKVLAQPRLQRKIRELAELRLEVELREGYLGEVGPDGGETPAVKSRKAARRAEIESNLTDVAEEWTLTMICKTESKPYLIGANYLASQLIMRAYHQGIHVSSEQVSRILQVAKEAAAKKRSIIFLPSHKSHVDYVSLVMVCFRLGISLPTVVAGDNLNFPVIGPFLQNVAAMYIRRSFGNDQLYNALVQSYIDTLMQNGFNIKCFIEGTRSRTGKLLQPKFGILSYLMEAVYSGSVEDALICSVSCQYDKVIEVDTYISELLGQPKRREDLAGFLSNFDVLNWKLGRIDIRFHEPWSLKGFITDQHTIILREPSMKAADAAAYRRKLLSNLAYRVLAEINQASVIMPTALVGTVLLTLRARGVGKRELVRRVDWLSDRVRAQGARTAHFAGLRTTDVVDRALEVLGPQLVGRVQGLLEETFFAEDRFQLSFYRNMTIHLFVLQAFLCTAVYTKVKLGSASDIAAQRISYAELYDYCQFLSSLFRAEFIFPTTPLEDTLVATLNGLETDKVLRSSRADGGDSNEIDYVELHPQERASGRENFDFYCFLVWPFVESSWLGMISLFMVAPPTGRPEAESWLNLSVAQEAAQLLGKTLYHQGDLSYFEAVNMEALKNAFTRSEESGIIIVRRSKEAKVPAQVRLAADWIPDRDEQGRLKAEGRLWDLCQKIAASRRESHDQRDGVTVRRRIVSLVQLLAKELWEPEEDGAGLLASKGKRRKAKGKAKGPDKKVQANL